jgi:hypothetical protein
VRLANVVFLLRGVWWILGLGLVLDMVRAVAAVWFGRRRAVGVLCALLALCVAMETGSWTGRRCRAEVGRPMQEGSALAQGERGRRLEEMASMGAVVCAASLEGVMEECRAGAVRMLSDQRRGSGNSNRNMVMWMW